MDVKITHTPTGETWIVTGARDEHNAKATVFSLKGYSSAYARGTLVAERV